MKLTQKQETITISCEEYNNLIVQNKETFIFETAPQLEMAKKEVIEKLLTESYMG